MRTSYVSSSSDVVVVDFPVTSPSHSPPVSKRCFSSSSLSSLSTQDHARRKKKKSRSRGIGGYGGDGVLFVKEVQTARA